MKKDMVLLACVLLAACGGAPDVDTSEPAGGTDAELGLELEARFNAYARALIGDDPQALERLMSEEVKARALEKGGGLQALRDKMFVSMQRQFGELPLAPEAEALFSVTDVIVEGDQAEVQVAFQGAPLEKPFYFVLEDGEYKLNLVRPGFSKPLPEGAAPGRDSYQVQNTQPYDGNGSSMTCHGGEIYVKNGTSGSVSCINDCGWWSGSAFSQPYGYITRYCDYNTWGTDVYVDSLYYGGWDCNDYC